MLPSVCLLPRGVVCNGALRKMQPDKLDTLLVMADNGIRLLCLPTAPLYLEYQLQCLGKGWITEQALPTTENGVAVLWQNITV